MRVTTTRACASFRSPAHTAVMAAAMALVVALVVALVMLAPNRAGAQSAIATPRSIAGVPVVQVAAGSFHTCALIETGLVYCWGSNERGRLGDGTTTDRPNPVQVSGLSDVVQIAAGAWHSCARRENGRVLCWGINAYGQLGDGTTTDRLRPVRVQGLSGITDIAIGFAHGCAVRNNGRVFCWGRNHHGQLGDGTTTQRPLAVRVNGAAVTGAVGVSAGMAHSCLLRGGGRITCWGSNAQGQLGQGDTAPRSGPVVVTELSSMTAIDSGWEHNCALRGNGRVFCWGNNDQGRLGLGSFGGIVSTPQRVDGIARVVALGLGGRHSCAIRETGRIYCWGRGAFGALGNGTNVNLAQPTQVVGPLMVDAVGVTGGSVHSCGLRDTGAVFCWGGNGNGQLGTGTTEASLVPIDVRS